MDDKNRKLALKNLQLKGEIDKLTECQTSLMKENIKAMYYSNRTHRKMVEILDESLKSIEKAYENTLKFKNEMVGTKDAGILGIEKEKPKLEANSISDKNNPCASCQKTPKPLLDKSNTVKSRKRTKPRKVFDKNKVKPVKNPRNHA